MFDNLFPACAFFFFFLVQISSRPLAPLFMPGSVPSGSESRDDCVHMFPDECPCRFPHYAWTAAQSAHSDFIGSRAYAYFRETCHLHFWQNDRGLLRATAVTREWNGHRIRVSTQRCLWRRNFSHCSCRDSNSQPFDHRSSTLSNRLSWLPCLVLSN